MIHGLNNTIHVLRETEGAIDAIGGVTITEGAYLEGVKCRVSNPNRGDVVRLEKEQGVELERVIKLVVWPATVSIEEGDIVLPQSGKLAGKRFKVVAVKEDSLLQASPRAHLELFAERYGTARTRE